MSAAAPALAFGVFMAGLLAWRAASASAPAASPAMAMAAEPDPFAPDQVIPGMGADQAPPAGQGRQDRNLAAFLAMIRAAEGTDKDGGYGALFGWPRAGRSFNPATATGHPKVFFDYTDKAGKTLKTSAAGAYQITWTTWSTYYVPFRAWASLNGYSAAGFDPETQDAFCVYLLDLDGALPYVKAGQLAQAVKIARRRWASLPGAGYDQPERSQNFVIAAYTAAGGTVA